MMNIAPDVAGDLSLYDYEALLYHWNDAHSGADGLQAPDAETAMAILERANLNPALVH